jgi:hypothetical protein
VGSALTFAAQASVGFGAGNQPSSIQPPPPLDVYEPPPRLGYVWQPGYWTREDDPSAWVWVEGKWIPAQPGSAWQPTHWEEDRLWQWQLVPGEWVAAGTKPHHLANQVGR